MFKRKSVRRYDETSIDDETLNNIKEYSEGLEKLFPDIKTEMKFVTNEKVKGTSVKAPYYIALFSEAKDGYLTNAGFMLEQMDLFLSSNGIGTCWAGMGNPVKEIVSESNLEFIILLAFGKPAETIYRKDTSEFNRKEIAQVSNVDNEIMQCIRLAPSAMNSQPWYYEGKDNKINIYMSKSNIIKNMLLGRMNKIDVGISIYFLVLVEKHNNKEIEFKKLDNVELKGYEYIITAKIK
jgi:nitroreductase